MRFVELFEQRSLVASKLKECIRDKGYTKVLNMSVEELLLYHSVSAKPVTATVFSQNVNFEDGKNKAGKEPYDLLLDVIDLCTIYY